MPGVEPLSPAKSPCRGRSTVAKGNALGREQSEQKAGEKFST